jgi:hypothetical protein
MKKSREKKQKFKRREKKYKDSMKRKNKARKARSKKCKKQMKHSSYKKRIKTNSSKLMYLPRLNQRGKKLISLGMVQQYKLNNLFNNSRLHNSSNHKWIP